MKYRIIIIVILFIDQLSKEVCRSLLSMHYGNSFTVFKNCLNLVKVWNNGVSFGMFHWLPNSDIIFAVTSIIIALIMSFLMEKANNETIKLGFAFIIGGAVGNVIDRFRFGAVFDFIDFHIISWHWPAFNLADAFICIGMFLLCWKWYVQRG